MTIEEIVQKEGRQPDCSGYVTKYDIECSDGLTIRPGAFDDDNGKKVPMVWMHNHQNLEDVLGHIYLESRDDGVYGLGYFNDSPKGQLAKLYVDHGDISSFSIYANKLKKKARDVVHGMIREVSLVLAGANRGAIIDSPISHSDQDEDEGEGVICMGDDYGGPIYGNDEALTVDEYLEHYGRKGMKWGKNLFKTEYEAHPREKGEEEEETGNSKQIRGPYESDGSILGYSTLSSDDKQKVDSIAKKIQSAVDLSNYVLEPWMSGGPEDGAKALAVQILVGNHAFSKDTKDVSFKNYLTGHVKLTVSDADKVMSAFNNAVTELKEAKAKEALPNTPGMNAKPSEKKEEPKEESKEELNRPKSREKKITGEGEKIEAKGEGLNKRPLPNKKEENESKSDNSNSWQNDSEWKKEYEKTYISKSGKDIADSLNDLASYSLHEDWSADGRKRTLNNQLDYIRDNYGNNNRIGEITLPKSIEHELLSTFEAYCRHNSNPKDQKDIQDKMVEVLNSCGIDSNFILSAKRKQTTGEKIKEGLKDGVNTIKDLFKHSDLSDYEVEDIIKHYISGELTMDEILEHAENEGGKTVRDVFNDMTDEQKSCVYYFMLKARQALEDGTIAKHSDEEGEEETLEHSDKEEDEMKKNVFDDATENKETTLSHADMEKLTSDVFKDAKSKGSLKDSFLAHADDYGIDNIEWLFPDDRKVTNTPTWIKRPDGWVRKVMNGVSHSPFSRIKSMFADITEPDARARGYVKGNRKVEEVFGLLKRSTTPTTVYKKQKLDRDDIIDITDFDVVSWLKTEMRGMLDEELARAFLIGDGRSVASSDKINEQNIRPIYSDDDLFVIRKAIAVNSSTTTDAKCKEFIRQCIKARKDYRGSGNPTMFTTEDMLTDLLLMEDGIGHALYDSQDKLATKLRVKEIVTVPVFENQTRTVGTATLELMAIIVNLDDYKVGADKGGSVSMFEDFDIDYNQEKYLIETRCSGALTVPYSAIVIESSSSVYLDVDPDDPSETRYGKSVSDLQTNVVVNDDSISGTLKYVTGYTGFSGDTALQSGHYLALKLDVPNGATTTLQLLNNGGSGTPVDLGTDDYAVGYIRSKNAKIVVTTTLAGVSVSKTYSLRLLKLESAS